ncbi:phage integrase family protein [Neobacillus bataviensis]|uniref:Phage integrase family protein n=1 Tax=Neobacillus bataviensis TaxID=220685 RepID=A0A561DD75_9BACI|nr:phage integrase family protein [Neobacillus bataviensis]
MPLTKDKSSFLLQVKYKPSRFTNIMELNPFNHLAFGPPPNCLRLKTTINPAAKIKEPKQGKRIPKFLTEREIEHLREACFTPMEKALFEFIFSTGCRIGEIVSLERNCINCSHRSAIVLGKGDKEREAYFNIRCDIWLKRYLDLRQDKDPAIFVTERHPHKMSVAQIRYIIKRISNRAEINKEIHPHQLRHRYATHLLNNGAPIDVIQILLGHKKAKPLGFTLS